MYAYMSTYGRECGERGDACQVLWCRWMNSATRSVGQLEPRLPLNTGAIIALPAARTCQAQLRLCLMTSPLPRIPPYLAVAYDQPSRGVWLDSF